MAPTMQKAYDDGIAPLIANKIDETAAFTAATDPFKDFMLAHVRAEDLKLFVDLSATGPYDDPKAIPLHIVIPSFMISELRRAFEICRFFGLNQYSENNLFPTDAYRIPGVSGGGSFARARADASAHPYMTNTPFPVV